MLNTPLLMLAVVHLRLEIGRFAEQASAAVTVTYGETIVFASVVLGKENPDLGYFPLHVEYQEKLYAGGRIKGSRWVKRPGRPSDEAILKARLIDRSIRPLFPKGFKQEVQVVVTVLSADGENDADIPAMYAVSTALALSPIPWDGPISAVRVGLGQEKEFIVNPTFDQRETSALDLVISGTQAATVMVEAGANEVVESDMLEAFKLAQENNQHVAQAIQAFAKDHGVEKINFTPKEISAELKNIVKDEVKSNLDSIIKSIFKLDRSITSTTVDAISDKYPDYAKSDIATVLSDLIKSGVRHQILKSKVRPDGRKLDEIRSLTSEVGLLPRTHGSAMFKRGATQALTITTLGSPSLNQLFENMEGESSKRYIHHYNMPPFTVGETGRVGWPSRREIGHGALAERALEPMIPSEEEFPYTIQVVSELMSSNGSTSMASVCGSTLSLMDAGVPLKKPVAGIAMGFMIEGDDHVVLTDIQGMEDHTGDMDFKVAGTKDGITAMQMDIKVQGIPHQVLSTALEQAHQARLQILDNMLEAIPEPRTKVSPHAPKITTLTIPVEKIGEVIGSGGRIIKGIIDQTGAEVDIHDDGRVFISSQNEESINQAKTIVENIISEVEVGQEFDGKVSRIMDFGAFVEMAPGKEGLVHVSNIAEKHINHPSDVLSEGDQVHVRVFEIDHMDRVNLTMLSPEQMQAKKRQSRNQSSRHRRPRQHQSSNRSKRLEIR